MDLGKGVPDLASMASLHLPERRGACLWTEAHGGHRHAHPPEGGSEHSHSPGPAMGGVSPTRLKPTQETCGMHNPSIGPKIGIRCVKCLLCSRVFASRAPGYGADDMTVIQFSHPPMLAARSTNERMTLFMNHTFTMIIS